jgi:hypothetical protein
MRAWWQRKPALHIASQRKVTLRLNGELIGTVEVVDRIAVWPAVEPAPGRATLEVSDDRG